VETMNIDVVRVNELKNDVRIDLKTIDDDFENVYKDLTDLEEELGSSPELNARGRFRDDGFYQAVQGLQDATSKLSDLFDKICKMI